MGGSLMILFVPSSLIDLLYLKPRTKHVTDLLIVANTKSRKNDLLIIAKIHVQNRTQGFRLFLPRRHLAPWDDSGIGRRANTFRFKSHAPYSQLVVDRP